MQTVRINLTRTAALLLLFLAHGAKAQQPVRRPSTTESAPPVQLRTQRPIPQPPIAPRQAPRPPEEAEREREEEERQPQQARPRSDTTQRRTSARQQGRFQLDFNKAEITDVVQTISDFTGRLFIVPDNVRGKITIIGPEDGTGLVTADEAYAAFLSALEANNWTVYPVGSYLKLVEKRGAANANVWTYVDPESPTPADERMVTKIIRLKHIDTDTINNPLRQLMSKDATIIPLPPDTLIVTEVSLNLRRIERIIEALDQPGGGEELRIIQIEYATASEIADKLMQIFEPTASAGAGPGRTRGSAPRPAGAEGATGGGDSTSAASVSRVIPDDRTNKLIVFANRKGFEQLETLLRQLDVPTGDTGRVNVYYLANANAEDLANTLQTLLQGQQQTSPQRPTRRGQPAPAAQDTGALFSGEVKISADPATNSLVVVASQQDYRNLVRVIEQLDIPRRQVFVEAVIMEVNLRDDTEFGFNFHGGASVDTPDGIAPIVIGNQVGQASSLNLSSLLSMGGFLAGIQGSPIPAVAELGINLPSFGVIMHAMTSSSDVNVLSTPHLLTSDNEEAEITVGQNVPFQAGYAPQGLSNLLGGQNQQGIASGLLGSALGNFGLSSFYAPIQRQNVELKLKIKPQINESDYVRLEIDQQTEEIAEQDPVLGPTTARRTAKTVIVAKDQSTVVIGGLVQERTIKSVAKTPILGDIPVLGWLFRDNSTTKAKTNLLLFLTPYIIRDQDDFRRIFERKMREREQFIASFYGTTAEYEVPIDFARKAGPVALLARDVENEMSRLENGGPGARGEIRIAPRTPVEPLPPAEAAPVESDLPQPPAPEEPAPAEAPAPPTGSEAGEETESEAP